jgi:hypothetical protein
VLTCPVIIVWPRAILPLITLASETNAIRCNKLLI